MTALPAYAQAAASPKPASPAVPASAKITPPPPPARPEEARQARLAADTMKLLQLAQELKTEVDKSSKDTLSFAVVKKASELEQLAHELKERMKTEAPKTR